MKKTVNKLQARIYAEDGAEPFPLHGAVFNGDGWREQHWTHKGQAFTGGPSELDLTSESVPK